MSPMLIATDNGDRHSALTWKMPERRVRASSVQRSCLTATIVTLRSASASTS